MGLRRGDPGGHRALEPRHPENSGERRRDISCSWRIACLARVLKVPYVLSISPVLGSVR